MPFRPFRCCTRKSYTGFRTICVQAYVENFMDLKNHERVLNRMKKNPELLNCIEERKLQYLSYIAMKGHKYETFRVIIEGKLLGKILETHPQN